MAGTENVAENGLLELRRRNPRPRAGGDQAGQAASMIPLTKKGLTV